MAAIETGNSAAGLANVDGDNNLQVTNPGVGADGVPFGGGVAAGQGNFSEIDPGFATGQRVMISPEVDTDFRMRVAHDNILDQETFNYGAQNTGKFFFSGATMTATPSAAGLTTNASNITTLNTGLTFGTFAHFVTQGTQTVACETSLAFTAQPNANTIVDFGMFLRGASAAYAPSDGAFFRLTAAGLQGVVNNNGTETLTAPFPLALGAGTFAYTNNEIHQYLIQMSNVGVTFWIDNVLHGTILTPAAFAYPVKSVSLPWSIRHAIVGGAAGAVLNTVITDYRVLNRGAQFTESLSDTNSRALGAYQGLSGNAMGQLVAGTVTSGTLVKPTAAVPLNASLAANLPNSLGGRIVEQLASGLAASVDGIFASFQNPAGSATVQGRRLKINGIKLSAAVSAAVTGGAVTTEFYIAFGHTAASLATGESASFASNTTKAPRRVMLPELTQSLTAAQAVDTRIAQSGVVATFTNPIYVNPGEFLALVGNKTATAPATAGIITHTYQFDYSWE